MPSPKETKEPHKAVQFADMLYRAGDTLEYGEHNDTGPSRNLDEVVPIDGTPISVGAYQLLGVFTVARRPNE